MKRNTCWILFFFASYFVCSAQNSAIYLGAKYGIQLPVGELSDRFGVNSNVGLEFSILTKNNYLFSIEGDYLFGRNVEQNTISQLADSKGAIVTSDYRISNIKISERGFTIGLQVSKIVDLSADESITGIRFGLGAGYLQHKIRIKEDQGGIKQFEDPYIRGYDRLTSGPYISQIVGFQHFDYTGRFNFFLGFTAHEAFTKDRRGFAYDTQEVIDENRLDILLGARASLYITIKNMKPPELLEY